MTKAYSAIDHALYLTTHDGVTFAAQGEPDADFIDAEFVTDTVSSQEGVKGDVQYSIRVAKMGTITFTCQWGSTTNANLQQVYKDQEDGLYLQRADVKRISSTENTTVVSSLNPKIAKLPNWTIGTEASNRAYIFSVEKMEFTERTAPA